MDPADGLRRHCYGGEELLDAVAVDGGAAGVTTHRLLVHRPDADGARFVAVDRPNVAGVAARTSGPTAHRDRAVTAAVAGGVLLVAGTVVDVGGLVEPVSAPEGMGIGGLLAAVEVMVAVLGLLDEALLLFGVGALLWALVSLVRFVRGRERVVEVAVAGDDPVRLPVAGREGAVAQRLRTALDEPGPAGDDAAPGD